MSDNPSTNLPRPFLIGLGLLAALFLLAMGIGIGVGVGISLKKTESAAIAPSGAKPLVPKGKTVTGSALKFVGKWEQKGTVVEGRWEFKDDGTGYAIVPFVYEGKIEWSIQGDVFTIDKAGERLQYRAKFESEKLLFTPGPNAPAGTGTPILRRMSKESEAAFESQRKKILAFESQRKGD